MGALAVSSVPRAGRLIRRIDTRAVAPWVLCGTLVLYLGFSGGGYALSVYGQAGIVVWWIIVLTCAWGLLPATRLTRVGVAAMLAFGAFTAWTALGLTWTISVGRSFQDLALITSYFGVLVLAIAIHRERGQAMRHSVHAVATGIVVVAGISLATRLWPGSIPSARTFQDAGSRLSWPLDYWNALASFTVLGVPLLLSIATSARRLLTQSLAAAAVPLVVLCGALTQSRGGLVTIIVALGLWLILVPERVPKLATAGLCAAASAALVAAGFHLQSIRLAQVGALEQQQASRLAWTILLVCTGTAVAQLGIGRVLRHATPPQAIAPPRRIAGVLSAGAVVVAIIVALLIGAPHKLSHVWANFKNPAAPAGTGATHFTASSGEGRYQYWVAGIHSAAHHQLTGSGPGTFQLDWLPRAHVPVGYYYVTNAHDLYVETYTELGFVGLGLLGLFILVSLGACLVAVTQSPEADRTRAAGITAAVVAFFVGAAFDWLWQVPVLVAIVMLLLGSVLVSRTGNGDGSEALPATKRSRISRRRLTGVIFALVGLAALVATALPLTVNSDITSSQRAVLAGDPTGALRDARAAVTLEPASAEAQIQLALVLEDQHQFQGARAHALTAVHDESQNWTNWLTLSRLDAETGRARAAVSAYIHARALDPESSLFRS